MDDFYPTGKLAAASRSLGQVPSHSSRCWARKFCSSPDRGNLLIALGANERAALAGSPFGAHLVYWSRPFFSALSSIQQSVKECAIALQRHAQVLSRGGFPALPLFFERASFPRETVCQALHHGRDQLISLFYGSARLR